jgi:hypothetical protein
LFFKKILTLHLFLIYSSAEDLESREQAALKQIEKSLENMNLAVPSNVQAIFDYFSSIYNDTKWRQNSIEILGEYIIDPPYDTVKVLPGKAGSALGRMSSMVSVEISLFLSLSVLHYLTLYFRFIHSYKEQSVSNKILKQTKD